MITNDLFVFQSYFMSDVSTDCLFHFIDDCHAVWQRWSRQACIFQTLSLTMRYLVEISLELL